MAAGLPEKIGRYEVLEEIGRGSMGRVYLALDPNIGRKLAIKVLHLPNGVSPAVEEEFHQRFVLEARAVGGLSHPGIVLIFDADTDPTTKLPFIAMEWVEGETLEQHLVRHGPLPIAEAAPIIDQLAQALDAAHSQGLVHRDVKPANVLIDILGRVKLSDFGVAKFAGLSQTQAGSTIGSPSYMSPEQIRSEPLDGRSDFFSLAVVLYEALTGALPFAGDTISSITYKILEIDPLPARSLSPELPEPVEAVLDRGLEKNAAERFQSGREFAEALSAATESTRLGSGTTPIARPPSATENAPPSSQSEGQLRGQSYSWRMWLLAFGAILIAALFGARELTEDSTRTAKAPGVSVNGSGSGESSTPASESPPTAAIPEPQQVRVTSESNPSQSASATEEQNADKPVAMSTLAFSYQNRLKAAALTVHVDGQVVWSQRVQSSNFLGRTKGREVRARIPVAAGSRLIKVRLEGEEGKVGGVDWIRGNFAANRTLHLRVVMLPPKYLRLSWRD